MLSGSEYCVEIATRVDVVEIRERLEIDVEHGDVRAEADRHLARRSRRRRRRR